jgi:hypothetical protein
MLLGARLSHVNLTTNPRLPRMGTNADVWATVGVFSEVLSGHFDAIGLGATDGDKMLATSGLHHSGGALKRTG